MAIQKRRVIYLSDEDWTWLAEYAKDNDITISNVIRDAIADLRDEETEEIPRPTRTGPRPRHDLNDPTTGDLVPKLGMVQFNSRPFQPVPKRPGK